MKKLDELEAEYQRLGEEIKRLKQPYYVGMPYIYQGRHKGVLPPILMILNH